MRALPGKAAEPPPLEAALLPPRVHRGQLWVAVPGPLEHRRVVSSHSLARDADKAGGRLLLARLVLRVRLQLRGGGGRPLRPHLDQQPQQAVRLLGQAVQPPLQLRVLGGAQGARAGRRGGRGGQGEEGGEEEEEEPGHPPGQDEGDVEEDGGQAGAGPGHGGAVRAGLLARGETGQCSLSSIRPGAARPRKTSARLLLAWPATAAGKCRWQVDEAHLDIFTANQMSLKLARLS